MDRNRRRWGFTLIEVLAVVAIIILIMSMALPGLAAMMRAKKWNAAVGEIQTMVTRARALATSSRTDFSVEFEVSDNGVSRRMWLESESNEIERIPDLVELQKEIGGGTGLRDFMERFHESGGRWKYPWTYVICSQCGNKWDYPAGGGSTAPCPKCKVNSWRYPPIVESHYYDIEYDPELAYDTAYADNARQGDIHQLGSLVVIDTTKSRHFFSWDSEKSGVVYGYDDNPDIRIGTNGALVQTQEPVMALRYGTREAEYQWRGIGVVRCTGRIIEADLTGD